MLVAVIDIKIVAITGADLNHFVRNILINGFIIFYMITDEPTEMHQQVKVMRANSKESKLLKQ